MEYHSPLETGEKIGRYKVIEYKREGKSVLGILDPMAPKEAVDRVFIDMMNKFDSKYGRNKLSNNLT